MLRFLLTTFKPVDLLFAANMLISTPVFFGFFACSNNVTFSGKYHFTWYLLGKDKQLIRNSVFV